MTQPETLHLCWPTLGDELLLPHSEDHHNDAKVTVTSAELLSLRYSTGCLWGGSSWSSRRHCVSSIDLISELVRVPGDTTTTVLTKAGDSRGITGHWAVCRLKVGHFERYSKNKSVKKPNYRSLNLSDNKGADSLITKNMWDTIVRLQSYTDVVVPVALQTLHRRQRLYPTFQSPNWIFAALSCLEINPRVCYCQSW